MPIILSNILFFAIFLTLRFIPVLNQFVSAAHHQ